MNRLPIERSGFDQCLATKLIANALNTVNLTEVVIGGVCPNSAQAGYDKTAFTSRRMRSVAIAIM